LNSELSTERSEKISSDIKPFENEEILPITPEISKNYEETVPKDLDLYLFENI